MKATVFFQEPIALVLMLLAQANRLGHHGGNDGHESQLFVEGIFLREESVGTERPDYLRFHFNRDADIGDIISARIFAGLRAVQEEGFFRNAWHDDGTARLNNFADDAFAGLIVAPL